MKNKEGLKIGLDFGMTNSTISFYDDESKALVNFKPNAAEEDYIPTVISYNAKKPSDISIGKVAKSQLTSKNFDTYEHFKLLLGKKFNDKIVGKNKTPFEVAKDYIDNFLKLFETSQQNKKIQSIVMTVPDTWLRERSNQTARENIEKIFESLEFKGEFHLESEPIAAAAYFCDAYKNSNSNKSEYNGFITVIDYGGGTLDITLCESSGINIKVLERHGFGEDNQTHGRAGVAFDEAVVEKLIADNKLDIAKGSIRFINLRNKFEEQKRLQTSKITEELKRYFKDPAILEGEVLFSLVYNEETGDEVDIHCEDLAHCFNKVNAPILHDSLLKMQQYFDIHGVDSSRKNQENFRVLLVGGFSNFYAVEAEIRKFFNAEVGLIDKRFEQPFPLINRSFAISRGAALIAKEMRIPVHTCPYNIGFVFGAIGERDQVIDRDVLIIKKGTLIDDIKSVVFSDNVYQVTHKSGKLRIFMDDGRPNREGRLQVAVDGSAEELFPNIDVTGNEYRVGFSVNRNLIPTIHVVDKQGSPTQTSLSKLLEKIGIMQK